MITVKKEFADMVIGFNGSGKPLGQRNDLHKIYNLAKANKRKDYLNMFEDDGKELEQPTIEKKRARN